MPRHHIADKGVCNQSYNFSNSVMNVRVGPSRMPDTKELMFGDCGSGEDS